MRSTAAFGPLLLLCACGRGGAHPPRVPGAGPEAKSAAATGRVRFAGRVYLVGELAQVRTGSVFLCARAPDAREPAFARKYELGDPSWSMQDGQRVLYFALNERDETGEASAAVGPRMVLEARYSPEGWIGVGRDEGAGVKATVDAAPGDTELAITLPARRGS
jgi:hypothetical protein